MIEKKSRLGQRDGKGATKDCFIFVSWFASNKLPDSMMYVGTNMVGMVETNMKVFYNYTINNIITFEKGGNNENERNTNLENLTCWTITIMIDIFLPVSVVELSQLSAQRLLFNRDRITGAQARKVE